MRLQVTPLERAMQKSKHRRLSAQAWRGMLERFEGSGLSAESFCEHEGVSLSSLKRWRLKVGQDASNAAAKVAAPQAAEFVDLGALRAGSSRVELRLDFGGGVILQLSRG
jgi:site-specific recombinase XerC